ncbi:DUF4249 domain-containing protein [Flavobacterium sp.]|uniref:DUF4249 domain-containing protein n=1 Tax=Flavobacterium sp. TaxID=239 RepID=UPI003752DB1A
MIYIYLKISILSTLLFCVASCTEPYALQTNTFEDAIVVEATITNEFKKQEIKLSRTYRLEDNGPEFEAGATVYVKDDLGNQYNFEENNGKYRSISEFQAVANRNYQLYITTNDGKSYSSSNEKLTTDTPIQDLVPEVTTKDGVRGVQISVNSFDPSNTSKYYRYEYEETYKVIAPRWVNTKAVLTSLPPGSNMPGEITLEPRTTEARICFSTKKSDNIILTKTNDLSEDRVNFPIRFISSSNYIIMHRYSILVKQYVQNLAAYTFYQTLKEISSSESILTQSQPGYFSGNVKSTTNPNEKVIGFFDVSTFSEKRLFFNFSDVLPNDPLPSYPYNCPVNIAADQRNQYFFQYCVAAPPTNCKGQLIFILLSMGQSIYYGGYPQYGVIPSNGSITIQIYPIQCGDCTSFSNNIRPSFWID